MSMLSTPAPGAVTLLPSPWSRQYDDAVDVYSGFDDDSLLHGFRQRAGMPAPGLPMTGWCSHDSSMVFGQFLSTLSSFAAQRHDSAIAEKAVRLVEGWSEAAGRRGFGDLDQRLSPGGHYFFDKFVGGLTDVGSRLGYGEAFDSLRQLTHAAEKNLDRSNIPASPVPELHSGRGGEWYTLSENLYRAAVATGDARYRDFGDVWNYDDYWNKFLESPRPADAWGVHAYSHLNTFGGVIGRYAIGGEPRHLQIAENAYEFFTQTQCYATGGFGPAERIQPYGSLADSLDRRMDSFETPCGTWAAFKLARQLIEQTGDGRYGAWIERLLYNAIGAAPATKPDGSHFYYADYRPTGGVKTRARDTFCCCSGTYGQAVSAYPELVFFVDPRSVLVNLFMPAEVIHTVSGQEITVRVETEYPMASAVRVRLTMPNPAAFRLGLRVPTGVSRIKALRLSGGGELSATVERGWAVIDRHWEAGEHLLEFELELEWQEEAISEDRPDRFALMRGPVVYVLDAWRHEPLPGSPWPADAASDAEHDSAGEYHTIAGGDPPYEAVLRPFFQLPENWTYRMYFDRASEPYPFY